MKKLLFALVVISIAVSAEELTTKDITRMEGSCLKQGVLENCKLVAKSYRGGINGVELNNENAKFFYKESCKLRDPNGCANYGLMIVEDEQAEKEAKKFNKLVAAIEKKLAEKQAEESGSLIAIPFNGSKMKAILRRIQSKEDELIAKALSCAGENTDENSACLSSKVKEFLEAELSQMGYSLENTIKLMINNNEYNAFIQGSDLMKVFIFLSPSEFKGLKAN